MIDDTHLDNILRRHAELPTHFIYELMQEPYLNPRLRMRLAKRAAQGELIRYDPKAKISKHNSYALNELGNRSDSQRQHRIAESIVKASVEIGCMETHDFEYIGWPELVLAPSMPRKTLDLMDEGLDPNRIAIAKGHIVPDGAPFRIFHKPTDQHINILDEIDRKTENLGLAAERRTVEEKFDHYHEFLEKKLYKSHYGWTNCFVRFFTITEGRKQSMMRLWEKKYGAKKNVLFAVIQDYAHRNIVSYPKADGFAFTMPYQRVGYPDFYLNKFWEKERPRIAA